VHRATLARRLGGHKVVIKVQHAGVADRLLQDLMNLETIGDTMKRLDPDFDFTPVISEWAKEVPKELDFRQEALNMQTVEANLRSLLPNPRNPVPSELEIDVSFPQVIDGLVTEKVMVMSFIDGFKIDQKDKLAQYGADRSFLVSNVTRAFAHQIFVDGFYTADPHPGNLMVDVHTLKPVLLDFGLTKAISEGVRYNFAKLLVAVAEQDVHGLFDALEGVGLRLRTDVPFDIALLAKYFFRDASTQSDAQKESSKRREAWKKKAEEHKRNVYVGDKVDVHTTTMGCLRKTRKGEIVSVRTVPPTSASGPARTLVKVGAPYVGPYLTSI
jgi:aarF domain-containing kinase